jgi:DNA-binding response OmpR family regulator
MLDREKVPIILVAAHEDVFNNIRDALVGTNLKLLHASTEQEALAYLERLRSEINITVIELELPDCGGWDLIRRITFLPGKPVKLIATTSTYRESFFGRIIDIGVDAVVPKAISPEEWRRTMEAVLEKSQTAAAYSIVSCPGNTKDVLGTANPAVCAQTNSSIAVLDRL